MFTLIIEDKSGAIADEYTFEEGEFTIGRSHVNDIILPADNISRRHARLFTQAARCYVEDLGSSNGVYVNGKRIMATEELGRSAQIKIGDFFLYIEGVNYDAGQGSEAEGVPPVADTETGMLCRLISQNFGQPGTAFTINKPVNLVGRGKDCNLTVIDPSVSRIQSKITVEKNGLVRVEDLKSSNGTYVNNLRIDKSYVNHGDRLRFGNVEFVVELPGQPALAQPIGDQAYAVLPYTEGQVAKKKRSGGNAGLIVFLVLLVLVLSAMVVYIFFPRTFSRLIPGGRRTEKKKDSTPSTQPTLTPTPTPTPKVIPKADPSIARKKHDLARAGQLLAAGKWAEARQFCGKYSTADLVARRICLVAAQEEMNHRQLNNALILLKRKKFREARTYIRALSKDSYYVKKGIQALYLKQIDRSEAAHRETLIGDAGIACKARKFLACHRGLGSAYRIKADEVLLKRIRRLERRMRRRRVRYQRFEPGQG